MLDPKKCRDLVRQIDIQLQCESTKPTLFQTLLTQCCYSHIKCLIKGGNGNDSDNRLERVWLDKRCNVSI